MLLNQSEKLLLNKITYVVLFLPLYEDKYRENADVAAFNPLKDSFLSDSFKTSSVYDMHHDTFSNCFAVFVLDLNKTVHVTEMRGIISDFLS